MLSSLKRFLTVIYNYIVTVKTAQAELIVERYLALSTDHADLERRQKELRYQGKSL